MSLIPRIIMHVDMDAFYASVEQRDHPELRGKPVVVGGSLTNRGVVAAASYEARNYGVRSAMSMAKALRLCPDAIRRPCHFEVYRAVSQEIHGFFQEFTPLIEPVSLDEAYLDISESVKHMDEAAEAGRQLKQKIWDETQLRASVGIAPNKYLAKIASDYDKPDGFCLIRPEKVREFLRPLPVRVIPGVGQKTEQRMTRMGIQTIAQLEPLPLEKLVRAFGEKHGERLYELARGIDEHPVVVERIRKSISQERTFSHDLSSLESMKYFLEELARDVAELLDQKKLQGRTIGIKVRFDDFRIITRAVTLDHATKDVGEITETAFSLLERVDFSDRKVRLLGVRVASFEDQEDTSRFSPCSHFRQPFLWEAE